MVRRGAVDLGKGAPGTGFGEGADFSSVEISSEGQFGAGVFKFALAGEKQAE